jgi:nicotinate-nucleotide adenylyltransferase
MSLLEKILYMADYIEPTRSFPGLEHLHDLAYEDLDRAMLLGLEMSSRTFGAAGTRSILPRWRRSTISVPL